MLGLTAGICAPLLTVTLSTLESRVPTGRLPYPSVLVSPPNVTYHMVFDEEVEVRKHVSAQGLAMDREVPGTKSRPRVVCIGDSQTFGYTENRQTWPAQLERLLHEAGCEAEVINLGKPGAGPYTYAMLLQHVAPHFDPDVVVVAAYSGNDASDLLRELSSFSGRELLLGPRGELVESAFAYPEYKYASLRLDGPETEGLPLPEVIRGIRNGPRPVLNGAKFRRLRELFELDVVDGGARLSKTTTVTTARGNALCALFGITQLEAIKSGSFSEHEISFKLWYSFFLMRRALQARLPRASLLLTVLPTALQTGPRDRVYEGGLGVVIEDLLRLREQDLDFEAVFIAELEQLAERNGFAYVDVVGALRGNAAELFYNPDSHYNIRGNKVLAEALLPAVLAELRRERRAETETSAAAP